MHFAIGSLMRIDVCLPFFPHLNNIPFSACKRILILWVVVFISSIPVLNQLVAQEVSNKPIPVFEVSNQTLDAVLKRLAYESKLRFTYEANDPVMDTKVTLKCQDEFPLTILSRLLENTGHTFKQIGNQIVIYRNPDTSNQDKVETVPAVVTKPPVTKPALYENNEIVQTLIPVDTVFVMDTIFRVDTLRQVDTVFVYPEKKPLSSPELPAFNVDHFQENPFRQPGWALDLSVSPILSNFSTIESLDDWSLRSFAIDGRIVRHQKRWSFYMGLQFSQFSQKFNNQYQITSGGFYQKDTLDLYYTVTGIDTTWIAVVDSSYLPLNSESYSVDRVNRLGYISLTGGVDYVFLHRPSFDISAKAGVLVSSLLYRNGVYMQSSKEVHGTELGDIAFSSPNIGLYAGIGSRWRLTDQLSMVLDVGYQFYLSSTMSAQIYDQNLKAMRLSVGVRYYL